jgi:uncharacterized protein VirK/YbjX
MYVRQFLASVRLLPKAEPWQEQRPLMGFAPITEELRWPSMSQVIGTLRAGRLLDRLKYQCRLLQAPPARQTFLDYLSRNKHWRTLFVLNHRCFYVPFRLYLDRRWSQQKRFVQCATDLRIAEIIFGTPTAQQLVQGQRIRLSQSSCFSVDLELNRISFHEGFWALSLKDSQGQALFNMTFGFLNQHAVLVASVQGVRAEAGCNLDIIQSITKHHHGLRPHHLLLNIFQLACAEWGVTDIHGIDPEHQVKKRRSADKQGFTFDYRGFWSELGAVQLDNQDWRLPSQAQRRVAEDIPARKRALYRKRYAWLDELAAELATNWLARNGSNCAATATAITSGSLPSIPGTPIGQVTCVSSSAL